MTHDLQQHLNLPPADQIGFVVRDLEASMARYEPLFGPFHTMDGSVAAATFRGETKDVELKIAFGQSGDLQIELIEWVSGESPHSEFIRAGREGMHHVRFHVDDCDAAVRQAEGIGYETFWYKALGEDIRFAYLERPGDPLIIEFLQMPEAP